jgi:tRNA A37 methylthiotransferase MiaB
MKILLIRPPATYIQGAINPSISLPIGLLYLASVLEKKNFDVEVFDAQLNVDAPVSTNEDGSLHMGYSWQQIEQSIQNRKPDLVGISCTFTAQFHNAKRTADIVKSVNPAIVTVVGGSHSTVRPEDFFAGSKSVDVVCQGEGEYTIVAVAENYSKGMSAANIPGTLIRDGEEIIRNPPGERIRNLDDLPLPAYHLINMEDYFGICKMGFTDRPVRYSQGFERAVSVITSRGCPFNCIFCSVHLHMGKAWRSHSADYVLHHVQYLIAKYNVKHIHFEDDNLSCNVQRFKSILAGLVKLGITWDTPNGIRVDTLTEELLLECKESGCVYLIFGVESGSQRILDTVIDKRLDLSAVLTAASWAKKVSLDVMAFYVIGFPGETRQDMDITIDFALQLQKNFDVTPHLFVATPLPGTRLEKICLQSGILAAPLTPEVLAGMTQGMFPLKGSTFTSSDIESSLRKFWLGYKVNIIRKGVFLLLTKPRFVFRLIHDILSNTPASLKQNIVRSIQLKNSLMRAR